MRKSLIMMLTLLLLLISATTVSAQEGVYLFSEIKGSRQYDCYLLPDTYRFSGYDEQISLVWYTSAPGTRVRPYFHNYVFWQDRDGMRFRVYYQNEGRETGGKVDSSAKNRKIYEVMREYCGNPYYGRDFL